MVIAMFFDNPNNEIKILTVLDIRRGSSHALSPDRAFHAISLRITGGADFTSGGKRVHASSGDIVYIPAHFEYRIDYRDEELICVHFELSGSAYDGIEVFSPSDSRYFISKFKNLYSAWSAKKPDFNYECKALLYKVLAHILTERLEGAHDLTDKKFSETIEYIHENYTDKNLSVEFLAGLANVSDTYYRKLFKQKYNETPVKYITSLRVALAKELLESGYYNVTETAERCGFDSQNYFSTLMKKETGKTPSEIKRHCQRQCRK